MSKSLLTQSKEIMEKERSALKWFPNTDGQIGSTGGANVLCGYISSGGTKSTRTYPCHNPIRSFQNAVTLWSCFGYRTTKECAEFYLDWLCIKSPWAKTGIVPEDYNKDYMFSQGFVWESLDKISANLLHNFLIATRMAAEWPKFIESWYELVTVHNCSPELAFVFLTCFYPVNQDSSNSLCCFTAKTESKLSTIDKYDWPLDTARATEGYVMNFCSGKPVGKLKECFSPTAHTTPVNTLWGSLVDATSSSAYLRFLDKTYSKEFTVKRTVSLVKQTFALGLSEKQTEENSLVYTPESILHILKLEQERLKLK